MFVCSIRTFDKFVNLCIFFRESTDCDIIELVHTVEVPTDAYKYPYCLYKYCVFSDSVNEFMKSPFEITFGHNKDGSAINRSLVLDARYIKKGSKLYYVLKCSGGLT